MRRPSGENATPQRGLSCCQREPLCLSRATRWRPLSACQRCRLPSAPTPATRLPSGENATSHTCPTGPVSATLDQPSAGFQSRTVPSDDADATRLPSRDQATQLTSSAWPSKAPSRLPTNASHSLTRPSAQAVTSRRPSGDHAAPWARAGCGSLKMPPSPGLAVCINGCIRTAPCSPSAACGSAPAVAIRCPSGENATANAGPVCTASRSSSVALSTR